MIPLNVLFSAFAGSLLGIVAIFSRHSLSAFWQQRQKIKEQIKKRKENTYFLGSRQSRSEHIEKESEKSAGQQKSQHAIDMETNALYKRADAFLARGMNTEAEKIIIQILAVNEDHLQANISLSLLFLKRGDFKKAESMQRKLIEMRPKDAAQYTNLGLALFNQKKFMEAIEVFQKAVELDNARAARHTNLGKVYFAIRDFEGANKSFAEAIRLEPRNLEYLFLLADSKNEAKDYTGAKKIFEKILKISPFNDEAKEELRKLNSLGF